MDLMGVLQETSAWIQDGFYGSMVRAIFPVNNETAGYTQDKYYSWRIFGSPYLFIDDPPQLGDNAKSEILGEWYYSQLQQSQILTLKMGTPKYTGNKSIASGVDWLLGTARAANEGEDMGTALVNSIVASLGMNISGLSDASKQYTFFNQYEMYMQYVRLSIISLASYLGVMNFPVPEIRRGTTVSYEYHPIKDVDWFSYTTNGHVVKNLKDIFVNVSGGIIDTLWSFVSGQDEKESVTSSGSGFYDVAGGPPAIIQFVVQPTATTDSFSNETTQSSAAAFANKSADIGREIAWLSNSTGSFSLTSAVAETTSSAAATVQGVVENAISDPAVSIFGSSLIGMVRGLTGERMIYPQIYSGSAYTKGLSFVIKLVSPYGDPYSYFMNIGLPLCYLLAMVAPTAASRNAYKMPFMCQAYVTGQAAVPMAIVESLSIQRGASGAMNKDGLPLEVEVNIGIKDLYSVISVASITDPAQFLTNESLMEYIASYSGIETWNKSLVNKYISGEISSIVAAESLDPNKVLSRIQLNLGKWGAEQLYMYSQANAAR